ncbi:aldehyde dehydrogenase [Pseudoduganella namucuonensis]|uniref:Acyl-CoA reductase n=1 Tax=Pseudoduganella namucuonensis TaxID=1035707 RepID=A0A1I7LDW0_9BURK|nr:aldehyde dehydrogenase [Pseudoduganella namucuonensis]SFV07869.1 Acyl-CoA reductase [Pseudoduganella namucuonensis]
MRDDARVEIRLKHADKLFINGRWTAPKKGGRIEIVSPHTERVCAVVAEASEEDMDAAVAAARKAFDDGPWPRMSPADRAAALRRLGAELGARSAELAAAWTEQVGALASFAPFMVGGTLHNIEHYASLAGGFPFVESHRAFDGQGAALVVREAVGVVAAIVPWNAPFAILVNKIAPALLAGCAVIMKPSPETPLEAYIIAEAAEAAGFPDGVVNLVPSHREAADYLVRNPGVDKVSFTGSTVAGRRIASVCGDRIARCTLELGGKSAAILLDDCDEAAAARTLAGTISMLSGQVCATLSRVIVPRARQASFTEALKAELEAIRVGDPYQADTQMGPMAMKRQLDRVEGYIARGIEEGARLVCGGGRPAGPARGHYLEPTLFAGVDSKMTIAQEEIFGPVIALLTYDDEAEAVRIANDSPFGLFGAVFTRDNDRAYRIARGVRTGALSQNAFRMDPFLPFGGFKQSGIGREGGSAGLASYTETKTVLLDGAPSI